MCEGLIEKWRGEGQKLARFRTSPNMPSLDSLGLAPFLAKIGEKFEVLRTAPLDEADMDCLRSARWFCGRSSEHRVGQSSIQIVLRDQAVALHMCGDAFLSMHLHPLGVCLLLVRRQPRGLPIISS